MVIFGDVFRGKYELYKAANMLFTIWNESVLTYWKYICLEGQRKTAEYVVM